MDMAIMFVQVVLNSLLVDSIVDGMLCVFELSRQDLVLSSLLFHVSLLCSSSPLGTT